MFFTCEMTSEIFLGVSTELSTIVYKLHDHPYKPLYSRLFRTEGFGIQRWTMSIYIRSWYSNKLRHTPNFELPVTNPFVDFLISGISLSCVTRSNGRTRYNVTSTSVTRWSGRRRLMTTATKGLTESTEKSQIKSIIK